jgi:2-polyprenyl-3-methyl-5-hydroxy-6-metoxy-1,4-benzoquinol methylase
MGACQRNISGAKKQRRWVVGHSITLQAELKKVHRDRIHLRQEMTDHPADNIEIVLSPDDFHHESGNCWTVKLPEHIAHGDDIDNPSRSQLELLENGHILGPSHADHNRIRSRGGGLYSHWYSTLYASTSDNVDPRTSGRTYSVRAAAAVEGEARSEQPQPASDAALFPRIASLAADIRRFAPSMSLDLLYNPEGDASGRLRMLEAKVEYILDEMYLIKAQQRLSGSSSTLSDNLKERQLETFDFQWKHLPYHDAFLTNPEWHAKAPDDLCARIERPREWLEGKRVLDCGCGPGRHAWTFAKLGAEVVAFDPSQNGIEAARRACDGFPKVIIEQRNILEALPYDTNFDLVWCYGVLHCTGDTYKALANIAHHVKPGGMIYFMVYPEPERTNFDSYRYYHEVHVLRQLTGQLTLEQKAEFLKKVQGERWALSWFDAISSEINDLYTIEELAKMLKSLAFEDVKRTMPHEHSLNVVATKKS